MSGAKEVFKRLMFEKPRLLHRLMHTGGGPEDFMILLGITLKLHDGDMDACIAVMEEAEEMAYNDWLTDLKKKFVEHFKEDAA